MSESAFTTITKTDPTPELLRKHLLIPTTPRQLSDANDEDVPPLERFMVRDYANQIVRYVTTTSSGAMNAYNAFRLWPTEESALVAITMNVTRIARYEHIKQIVDRLLRLHRRTFDEKCACAKSHQFFQNYLLED